MLNVKTFLLLLVILLIFPKALLAQEEIVVTKTAPSQINYGQNLTVTITVANNLNQRISVTVRENVADAQVIEPQIVIPKLPPNIIAAIPPYFEWHLTIDANSKTSVSYTIKPNKVGYYLFSPTVVITDDGKIFYSNTLSTFVKCNTNNICEESIGEDYTNCPEDCKPPIPPSQTTIQIGPIYILIAIALIVGVAGVLLIKKKSHKKQNLRQKNKQK